MKLHLTLNPHWTEGFDMIRGRVDFDPEEQTQGLPATLEFRGMVDDEPDPMFGEICFEFPKLDEGNFPGPPPCRRILLSTYEEEIDVLDEEITEPSFRRVAEHFPRLFTAQHWTEAYGFYRLVRNHLAESCDLLEFENLPAGFLFHEVFNQPEADELTLRDLFQSPIAEGMLDGTTWLIDESYFPARKSGSLRVHVEFRTTVDGLEPDLTDDQYEILNAEPDGHPEFSCPSVTLEWDLDSGEVTETARNKTQIPVATFLDLLLQVIPDARERFRRRHQHLVDNLAKIPAWRSLPHHDDEDTDEFAELDLPGYGTHPYNRLSPTAAPGPIVRTAPKVGRNDPCPCGSGKKAKKCCGAS